MRFYLGTRLGPLRVGVITDRFNRCQHCGELHPLNPYAAAFWIGFIAAPFLIWIWATTR